jgi:hypothetical protein
MTGAASPDAPVRYFSRDSAGTRVHSYIAHQQKLAGRNGEGGYLVEIDGRFPELGLHLVEVSHTDLSKVTGMVFVHVGSVVVLTTGQTTTTGICS